MGATIDEMRSEIVNLWSFNTLEKRKRAEGKVRLETLERDYEAEVQSIDALERRLAELEKNFEIVNARCKELEVQSESMYKFEKELENSRVRVSELETQLQRDAAKHARLMKGRVFRSNHVADIRSNRHWLLREGVSLLVNGFRRSPRYKKRL